MGDSNAAIYPDGHSCLYQWAKAALPFAGGRLVGDQLDIDAPLLCPDECLDGARASREAVSTNKNLLRSPVNRIDGEGGTVLLGRKAYRNRRPGSQRRDGYGG